MNLAWGGTIIDRRSEEISVSLGRVCALVVLCLLPLFVGGCAAAPKKAAGKGCRGIEQTLDVNGRQETMKTIACRRPEGKPWDSP